MSLRYLPQHTLAMLQSLELARKEAVHLRYSQSTLFALPIDLAWVENLGTQPELAEKVEAFVSRFGRLQDHLGEKLLPRYATLVGETIKTQIDTLAFAERAGVLGSADAFIAARRLRNALVHEYMQDTQLFLDSLLAANPTCGMFYNTIAAVEAELKRLGVSA
jgi:phytoene dehydrogenase-like protein